MVRIGMAAAVLALTATPLFAQESTEQLKKELEQLRAEVDSLKAVNQTREIPATGGADVDAMAADESPVMTLFKQTKLSGFVDTSYNYSLRGKGEAIVPFLYRAHVFDTNANTFALQSMQLNLERLASKDMIVGYHVEVALGRDPAVYAGTSAAASTAFGLQEAWVQILAPIGNGLDIRVGKMAMLCGYEVIESMNDMNFSRGLIFASMPFFSTGVRLNYSLAEQANITLGLNNGWNSNIDGDLGKTFEFQLELKPMKDLKIDLTALAGDETAFGVIDGAAGPSGGNGRILMDLIVEYKMDKLTAALEFEWGVQAVRGSGDSNPAWGGAALFLKYQMMDIFAPALRIEYFSQGFGRPGLLAENNTAPSALVPTGGIANRTIEFTLTGEFKIGNHLILRVEYRHDDNNLNGAFGLGAGNLNRGQDELAVEAIMPF